MNTKNYFDHAADTWDTRYITPKLLSFLEQIVPKFGLKSGQRVLDVGTGTGVLIPFLIKALGPSGEVTAIDLSEKMVQKCKTKHSHFKNVNVTSGNIEDATFPAESFDAVICFGVFPHLKNKEKSLENISRILKISSKLVIAHALSSEELKTHHKKASKHVANATIPEKNEMIRLLKQTGFNEISIKDETGCYLCISHKTNKTKQFLRLG